MEGGGGGIEEKEREGGEVEQERGKMEVEWEAGGWRWKRGWRGVVGGGGGGWP